MSAAEHDTPEAVEAMASAIEPVETFSRGNCAHCGEYNFNELEPAAAMLRRLHARAVKADKAHGYLSRLLTSLHPQCEPLPDLMGLCTQIDNAMTEIPALRAALATARADALREAAALIECGCKNRNDVVAQRPNSAARWNLCEHPNCMAIEVAAILALIPKEPTR